MLGATDWLVVLYRFVGEREEQRRAGVRVDQRGDLGLTADAVHGQQRYPLVRRKRCLVD